MKKHRILFALAAGTLAFTACGSDDDGGNDDGADVTIDVTTAEPDTTDADTDTTEPEPDTTDADDGDEGASGGDVTDAQSDAARQAIDQAAADGVELDEECVNDVAAQLSDADAEAIASGNDADVSPEGQTLALELIACADEEAIADLFIEGMNQSGQDFDEECVREKLQDVDITELVAATQSGSEPPAEIVSAMMECFDLGS
jgi:hypothetical protein